MSILRAKWSGRTAPLSTNRSHSITQLPGAWCSSGRRRAWAEPFWSRADPVKAKICANVANGASLPEAFLLAAEVAVVVVEAADHRVPEAERGGGELQRHVDPAAAAGEELVAAQQHLVDHAGLGDGLEIVVHDEPLVVPPHELLHPGEEGPVVERVARRVLDHVQHRVVELARTRHAVGRRSGSRRCGCRRSTAVGRVDAGSVAEQVAFEVVRRERSRRRDAGPTTSESCSADAVVHVRRLGRRVARERRAVAVDRVQVEGRQAAVAQARRRPTCGGIGGRGRRWVMSAMPWLLSVLSVMSWSMN